MTKTTSPSKAHPNRPGYFTADECQLSDLEALTSQTLDISELEFAERVEKNIPIYDVNKLQHQLANIDGRKALMAEWAYIYEQSSGVLVLKNAVPHHSVIDDVTDIYAQVIEDEKLANGSAADHFATAGNNDRIWNSLQKLCERSPDLFAQYFGSPAMDAACEAWLGPNYQMTAQVNLVRPGGKAQTCHRDYHLGFQTAETCAQYPAHVHLLSPYMTLQGGIAHCDMSIESGPTKLLPFSQNYDAGYAAYRREDFQQHFEAHFVQMPLSKGDAIFFNPALYHAAGPNMSQNIDRLVNLVQISSAFGRSLENIDRIGMCKTLYPSALKIKSNGSMTEVELAAAISSCAEGYPFPTNLDTDPPVGGLAPESQNQLFHRALNEGWTPAEFNQELDAQANKQTA